MVSRILHRSLFNYSSTKFIINNKSANNRFLSIFITVPKRNYPVSKSFNTFNTLKMT